MAFTQDCSIGIATESTFKTFATPTRWYEFTDESLDWVKAVKQGQGLRVGSRVARSARRVVPTADGGGAFTIEATSKGMGLLLQAAFGTGVSTLVSGSTQQQLFTLGDTPSSLTIQKGLVQANGTVDAYSMLGCTPTQQTFNFPNSDIATVATEFDIADITTAQAYGTPSYPTTPNLFHFGNLRVFTGTLTAPTTTVLASATTELLNVRDATVQLANNPRDDRFNSGGNGRKSKQLMSGMRVPTGSITLEYDATTFRDAMLNETETVLVLQYTAGALSTGVETFQIVLPAIKFDAPLVQANQGDLITTQYNFTALDNQTAAQPIWGVIRTADAAL